MCTLTPGAASELIIYIQYCDNLWQSSENWLYKLQPEHSLWRKGLQQLFLVVEWKYFEISQPSLKLNSLAINKKMHPKDAKFELHSIVSAMLYLKK